MIQLRKGTSAAVALFWKGRGKCPWYFILFHLSLVSLKLPMMLLCKGTCAPVELRKGTSAAVALFWKGGGKCPWYFILFHLSLASLKLPMMLLCKGTCAPVAPPLLKDRGQCPRHAPPFRRTCLHTCWCITTHV